jgi:hypothetical protein
LLEASKAKLIEKQLRLAGIEEQLLDLKKNYEVSLAEKQKLEEVITETKKRLDRASKITTGLAEEQIRWAKSLAHLDGQRADIIGDTFFGIVTWKIYLTLNFSCRFCGILGRIYSLVSYRSFDQLGC